VNILRRYSWERVEHKKVSPAFALPGQIKEKTGAQNE
tara:strand:+ start:65 stop:175 length:111 start_codon:yes stop_codon:yes gene_type:complete